MMSPDELSQAKYRLMHGAAIASALAGLSSDEELQFSGESYEEAVGCLVMMTEDLSMVLAELDVLRGMFDQSVQRFLKGIKDDSNDTAVERDAARLEENISPSAREEHVDDGNSTEVGTDVGGSRPANKKPSTRRSKKARDDDAPVDKRSGGRRSSGKRTKRPESTRDTGDDKTDS
jgi:GTPase